MVYTGEVGISYDHGELRILDHGRHIIDASTHLFEGFLSTQQKSIRLVTETHEERMEKKRQNEKKRSAERTGQAYSMDQKTGAYFEEEDFAGLKNADSAGKKKQ